MATARRGEDLAWGPVFPVLQASPVKCPILEKYKLLANHSDTKTPLHSFPSGRGSPVKLFAHGQGREIGLLRPVSEPYGVQDSVV